MSEDKKWPELPERVKICIYRFPFGFNEHSTTVDWLMNALFLLHSHPRVGDVCTDIINDTPVDMSRNRALKNAKENGCDFAIFLDADMAPDYQQRQQGCPPEALPFLPGALDFALAHDGPCCVGAPYCSSPPDEMVLVMRWRQQETDDPDGQLKLDKYTREETIGKTGIEEVAALPTGLLLIDMRALSAVNPPYFSYQWKDAERTQKASTEDVVFTRDLSIAGIPQYVYWNAWAGHWKAKMVQRPIGLPVKAVPERMRRAITTENELKFKEKYGHLLKGGV